MKILKLISQILLNKTYAILGKHYVFTEKCYISFKDTFPNHYVEFHKFHFSTFAFVSQKCPVTTPNIRKFSYFYNDRELHTYENELNILSYSVENPDIENNIFSNKNDNIPFIPGRDSFCKLCENKFQCLYSDNKGIQQNKLTYRPFKNILNEEFLNKLGFKQDEKLRNQVVLMISYD